MKRGFLAIPGALLLLMVCMPRLLAAPLVLAKNATGTVQPNLLALELKSLSDCDQTQSLIPDGSKLVTEQFALVLDEKGVGIFNGKAKIVTPDGRIVFTGSLHGTVGLTAHPTTATTPCMVPRHLEGMLNPLPPAPTDGSTDPALRQPPFEVNVSLDVIPQANGILPQYKGVLAGVIAAPSTPPPPQVMIWSGKPQYTTYEQAVANIANKSDKPIQIFDLQSFCTIVQMQRLVDKQWVLVGGCPLARMPMPVVIKPGTTMKVALPPQISSTFRHVPGVYRFVVDYQFLNPDGAAIEVMNKAVSPVFKIEDIPQPGIRLAVKPDRTAYLVTDPITALITNGSVPVSILDMETQCTIVQLQKRSPTGWVEVDPCLLDRIPIPTLLKPGEQTKVLLAKNAPWEPGEYRLAVKYSPIDANGKLLPEAQIALSAPFPITPSPRPAVMLTSDRGAYEANQPVIAVLANNGSMDIVTWDHRTMCTIVELQIRDTAEWRTVYPCMLKTPTLPVTVKAGEILKIALPPDNSTAPKWETGIYRLRVVYAPATSAGTAGNATMVALSMPFSIGPVAPPTSRVSLTTDKRRYLPTEPIAARITNELPTGIVTWDHRSFCGVINLQLKVETGWKTVAPCMILSVPQEVPIKAGGSLTVQLPPNATTTPKWEQGMYRLNIVYAVPDNTGIPAVRYEAMSEPFAVGLTTGMALQTPEMTTITLPENPF